MCHCQFSSLLTFWPTNGLSKGRNLSFRGGGRGGLLDLTCCGGSGLAAHAGGVDCFRWNQIQVFIIWNLIQPVAVLQELDVQVLVDLLQEQKMANTALAESLDKQSVNSTIINRNTSYSNETLDKAGHVDEVRSTNKLLKWKKWAVCESMETFFFFFMSAHIPGVDGNNGTGWSGKVVCRVIKWCWETISVCINTWSLRHLTSAEEYPDEEYLDMSKSSSLKYKRNQQLWVMLLDYGQVTNHEKLLC